MSFITGSHLMPRICPASADWEDISERCEGRDQDSCGTSQPLKEETNKSPWEEDCIQSCYNVVKRSSFQEKKIRHAKK